MKNSGCIYTDRIQKEHAGLSVIDYYTLRYRHSNEEEWRQRVERGLIQLNGRPASINDPLSVNDILTYHRPPWEEPEVPDDVQLLYEDKEILVLGKPAGLPVLPAGGFLEHTLLHRVRRLFGAGCSPLHRLGRGTSGAILFTRSSSMARFLGRAMQEKKIRKVYLALATGTSMPDSFHIDAAIGPVPHPSLGTIHAFSPCGRPAVSHVRVIRRFAEPGRSLLEVTIPTGRPHQIRIHLSHAGYPLAGEPLYTEKGVPGKAAETAERPALPGDCGYHLHSWKISFPLPGGGCTEITCPPPGILDPGNG